MSHVKVLTAPERSKPLLNSKKVFLAGSIEMGKAEPWQDRTIECLSERANDQKKKITIFNPRRSDWDSSWKQEMENTQFFDQVSWELDHIEKSDTIVIYFDPSTKSPITLLELGKVASSDKKVVVFCPKKFYRKGNVDIVCYRNDIPVAETYEEFQYLLYEALNLKANTSKPETKQVEESVESVANIVELSSLYDSPTFEYDTGESNTIVVEDFEFIENSCMMGKWKFKGREVYTGICNEDGINKIKLRIRRNGNDVEQLVEFELKKAADGESQRVIISE